MKAIPDHNSLISSNILVTGGAGFIGCALSNQLAEKVNQYLVLDCLHPQVHKEQSRPMALHGKAELVIGDVTESAVWDLLLERFKPDIVIHLAAETGTGQSLTEATRHGHTNVVGTTCMTDALVRHDINVKHMLLTSSRAVYGEGAWISTSGEIQYPGQRSHAQLERKEWDFPALNPLPSSSKSTFPDPTSVYGATKLAQEHILKAWALAFNTPFSILRLQNVYGPGQSLTNSYTGIVALFSRLAKAGTAIPLYEDGHCTRDFVSIDDVVAALIAALNCKPIVCETFDIGSGAATSIQGMANIIADHYSAPRPIVTGQFRDGDVRHAACAISRTLDQLQWKPTTTLQSGLANLQRWIDLELQGF